VNILGANYMLCKWDHHRHIKQPPKIAHQSQKVCTKVQIEKVFKMSQKALSAILRCLLSVVTIVIDRFFKEQMKV